VLVLLLVLARLALSLQNWAALHSQLVLLQPVQQVCKREKSGNERDYKCLTCAISSTCKLERGMAAGVGGTLSTSRLDGVQNATFKLIVVVPPEDALELGGAAADDVVDVGAGSCKDALTEVTDVSKD